MLTSEQIAKVVRLERQLGYSSIDHERRRYSSRSAYTPHEQGSTTVRLELRGNPLTGENRFMPVEEILFTNRLNGL